MQVSERAARSAAQYAEEVRFRGSGTFKDKALRDKVAMILTDRGYTVRKSRSVNQQLHPEYVTDYVGRLETGFGNCQYQMYWSTLYELKVN